MTRSLNKKWSVHRDIRSSDKTGNHYLKNSFEEAQAPGQALPKNIYLIFQGSGFLSKTCQLIVPVLKLNQLLFKLLTVNTVIIFCSFKP